MNTHIPHTPFSTPLSRSAQETELRLKHIFSGPKKRPSALFLALVFSLCLLCGNLVSCQMAEAEDPDMSELTADLTFAITEGETVNIQGTVGGFVVPSGTSWNPDPAYDVDLLGQILVPYPPFSQENGMIAAWWADESRTAVTVTGQPLPLTTSGADYTGWRTFTVSLDGNGGNMTESHTHNFDDSDENIYLAALSDREAVTLARFAARLLAGAEDYYQNHAGGVPFQAAPDLDRNGVPEELRLYTPGSWGTGQQLEVWEDGQRIWTEEGHDSHPLLCIRLGYPVPIRTARS